MSSHLRVAALAALSLLFAPSAFAQSSFTQLAGGAGCIAQPDYAPYNQDQLEHTAGALAGCDQGRGLVQAEGVVISPDQKNVYVAASGWLRAGSNAVVALSRDAATGALKELGCVSNDGGDGRPGTDGACADGDALLGARDLAITPDGLDLYVAAASSNGIAWFRRDPETGAIKQSGCLKEYTRGDHCGGAFGLVGADAVAVSPDGKSVYVTSNQSDGLLVFSRDAETGDLTAVQCVTASGSDGLCVDGTGLDGASAVTVSPDGAWVYVTAADIGSLLTFARDPETGLLTQTGCLLDSPVPGSRCGKADHLAAAGAIAVSADGRDVYVGASGDSSITLLQRGDDGALAQTACVEHVAPTRDEEIDPDPEEDPGDDGSDDDTEDIEDRQATQSQCQPARALGSVRDLALTPDGRSLVATGYGSLAAFDRDPATGALRQSGCAEAYRTYKSCVDGAGLEGTSGVAISADGRNVYVASRSAHSVAVFGASVAVSRSARVAGRSARVVLACPAVRTRGCSGRLRVLAAAPRSAAHARAAAARASSAAARGVPFRLAPGTRATVRVALPTAIRARLAHHRSARLTVSADDSRGVLRATRRRVLLRRGHSG